MFTLKKWIVWIGIIAAILIVLFLVFRLFNHPITNYPSKGENIIAFGDSLVVGIGSDPGNDFVTRLSAEIDQPIINAGVSGDTTRDGLLRLEKEVLSNNPKIVLLLLGGNDYLQKIPKEETFVNLGYMIDRIHDSGAIVVLLGVRGGLLKDNYDQEYKKLAKEKNTAYVENVLKGLLGNHNYMSDTIHPSSAGYKIIADRISPVLKELIK